MTEEKRNHGSDRDLLALLERSPQEGTAELFHRYGGLVWSVAGKYLENPEDIRECVNDTFLEFYLHRERFQPEKGELKAWLAAIARNLAISRFRKNAALNEEEWKEDVLPKQDSLDEIEKRMDLEQAMESLSQEEMDLIRMKYYQGMTVQEIAASLGLPFETVKKRHQRTLKRLKRMLTLGLVIALLAALLAACAYLAMRYFGIVPGYGVIKSPEEAIYTLVDTVATEDYYGTYTVTEAIVMDGTAWIFVDIRIRNEDILREIDEMPLPENPLVGEKEIVSCGKACIAGADVLYDAAPVQGEGMPMMDMLNWHVIYVAEDVLPPEDGMLTLHLPKQEIGIPMKPAEVEEQKYYSGVMHELGGLLAIPRPEGDRLCMEIYPLNTGEHQLSPNLIRDAYMQGKTGDITLVGADGREYVGEQVYRGRTSFSTWDFGPVEPGAYTLRIPYVFLTAEVGYDESNRILVDLKAGQWEDKAIELPCGTISMVSVEPMPPEELPEYVDALYADLDFCYRCVLRWEPPAADKEMYYPPVMIEVEYVGGQMTFAPEPLPDHCYEMIYGVDNECASKGASEDREDLSEAKLVPCGVQNIRWDCAYEIPVVVE